MITWPVNIAYMRVGDMCRVPIHNDEELQFASRLLAESMWPRDDFADEIRSIEEKVEEHMRAPEEDPEDDKLHSDDDITQEDFYIMGFRHEITN